jgi:hypothetical protein
MQVLVWPFLDALQTGALLTLFIGFGTDALSRRDGLMGWLSLTCLLVGLRHALLAWSDLPFLNPDLVDRAQSLLVAFGFITLCKALTHLFPRQVSPNFPLWITLGMLPNFLRNLVLPHPGFADTWLHHAANLTYLVGCGCILAWTLRARQEGDPMGHRLFLGFLGLTLPVVVEIAALSLFDLKVRLSGFSLVILAMSIGTSWQWLVVKALESHIQRAETEAELWRTLVPGPAFCTDQPSAPMENLFGSAWSAQVKAHPEAPLLGADGGTYRLRTRLHHQQERLGWCEREDDSQPGARGFLSGWTVGLGMDDAATSTRLQGLLRAWGAEVQAWGTVPPREGPYPSILLWAREPSILTVWRESDLLRRRPRWVQIGGPETEGPHARLAPSPSEDSLRRTLEELLSRR